MRGEVIQEERMRAKWCWWRGAADMVLGSGGDLRVSE